MAFTVRESKGLERAREDLRALPSEVIRAAATDAVNAAGETAAERAATRTSETYNVTPSALKPFIFQRRASPGGTSSTVELQIKALPLSVFDPRVVMRPVTLKSQAGRSFTRALPQIQIKRFRRGGYKSLKPFFALRTRSTGPLEADDQVRRRIGAARDRLTGARFYTFPSRFLKEKLMPDLQGAAGRQLAVSFRAATRKHWRGMAVLHLNN